MRGIELYGTEVIPRVRELLTSGDVDAGLVDAYVAVR
jgi:hypothetical protein